MKRTFAMGRPTKKDEENRDLQSFVANSCKYLLIGLTGHKAA